MSNIYFYHDKPVFGLDLGSSNIKVMQIEKDGHKHTVTGYGSIDFDRTAVGHNGVIIDPERIAQAAYELFEHSLVGEITTRRVAIAIPASRTFNRNMRLPKMKKQEIKDAVRLEAEQYIPVPLDELYLDYEIIHQDKDGLELQVVAVPIKIVDSYLTLSRLLGLETVTMETTISASSRLFVQAEPSELPTVLIDMGGLSSDITIYDNALIVTSTVPGGGQIFTECIGARLGVNQQEATIIKTKYGLGYSKKQSEITEALNPVLLQLGKEIRRMIRYYEERANTNRKIGQVVTMGGGASMPGLSEYLTSMLRLPVRMCDPWQHLDFGKLKRPIATDKSMYVTGAGLALIKPKDIFK